MAEEKSLSRRLMAEAASKLMLARDVECPGITAAEGVDAYDLLCDAEECIGQARIQLLIERREEDDQA